jgi:hypothetical protein
MYIGALVWMIASNMLTSNKLNMRLRQHKCVISVCLLGLLLWPSLWHHLVQDSCTNSNSFAAFLWPIMAILFEIYTMRKYGCLPDNRRGLLQMDANTLCSMTFALSGVLGARSNKAESKIFNTAVLCCVAFVLPSFNAPHNSMENIVLESAQKICLIYSTGVLLAGSIFLVSKCKDDEK